MKGKHLKKARLIATIAAFSLLGKGCKPQPQQDAPQQKPKTEQNSGIHKVFNPVTTITFTVDTLDSSSGALAFCCGTNIVRNFIENNELYCLDLSVMVHENKHRDNVIKGLKELKLSPLQYAKMNMHDEISASMCELLTLRYEYLAAKDKQAYLEKATKGKFAYYFKAVANGDISPEAQDEKSREQEWAFIAKETKNWWMKVYAPVYIPRITRMLERYLDRIDPNTPSAIYDINYKKVPQITYNIGGIDFGKYMGEDIQIADEQISLINKVGLISLFKDNKKKYCSCIKAQINRLKENNLPLSQEIVTHVFIAEGLKTMLKGIDADAFQQNSDVITLCYHYLKKQLKNSPNASDMFKQFIPQKTPFAFLSTQSDIPNNIIQSIYSYKNTDLSQCIFNFNDPLQKYGTPTFETFSDFFYENMIHKNLNTMRIMCPEEEQEQSPSPPVSSPKSRKSLPQTLAVPDFSQPILINATPEQSDAIYRAIRDFNNIPAELKGCDLAKQALYYKKQQTK